MKATEAQLHKTLDAVNSLISMYIDSHFGGLLLSVPKRLEDEEIKDLKDFVSGCIGLAKLDIFRIEVGIGGEDQ